MQRRASTAFLRSPLERGWHLPKGRPSRCCAQPRPSAPAVAALLQIKFGATPCSDATPLASATTFRSQLRGSSRNRSSGLGLECRRGRWHRSNGRRKTVAQPGLLRRRRPAAAPGVQSGILQDTRQVHVRGEVHGVQQRQSSQLRRGGLRHLFPKPLELMCNRNDAIVPLASTTGLREPELDVLSTFVPRVESLQVPHVEQDA
mmetsp:Transcript_47828/g.121314  ORF Transcript_47828/g.121314 Transcript_47828/m.121314 type:complete len:203 (-) Transcript_47828:523-1131(-)